MVAMPALEQIADSFQTTAVTATTDYARGRLLLAQGDAAMAMTSLHYAVELWHELGTPYETAKARTALGEALRDVGDENAGRLESSQPRRLSNVLVPLA